MNNKQRAHASLEGRAVDRFPVTAIYNFLVYDDHFEELTGEPQWRYEAWYHTDPDEHLRLYRKMVEAAPFELLQPCSFAPIPEARERYEFVEKDGVPCRHDKQTDTWEPLQATKIGEHAHGYHANEKQLIFDIDDVKREVVVKDPHAAIAAGANDYLDAATAAFGKDQFIVSGGVIGAVYCCQSYVGLTNLFAMMLENTSLLDALIDRIVEQNLAEISRLAAAGGDAIYIDDAMTTNDMISVRHYERFSMPYMAKLVDEIHRFGHKAILIYYGGIADRLEQIASLGADGLVMECSMKSYVNDIEETVQAIGDRVTVFSNIDPIEVIQNGTTEDIKSEIRRQCIAGRKGRGFVIAPPSPITPSTSVRRIREFIDLSIELGISRTANTK